MITIAVERCKLYPFKPFRKMEGWEVVVDCGKSLHSPFIVADTAFVYLDIDMPLCDSCTEDCPIKEYVHGV